MHPFKHLATIARHKHEVFKLCVKCGIVRRGLLHDLSKFSPSEFIPGAKYWTGKRSPVDSEIDDKGYSLGWLHHVSHNKHHYEYWMDISHDIKVMMPMKYIAEMFCDRVAASKTYLKEKYTDNSPLDYAKSKTREENLMDYGTYHILILFFERLSEYGEDYTCKTIKNLIRGERADKR